MRVKNCKLLVYPEVFDNVLSALVGTYEFCYILHDKDNSQPHYHFLVVFPSQRLTSAIARELGIDERFIRNCPDVNIFFKYLVHSNNPEKYQYSYSDIQGENSLIDKLSNDVNFDNDFRYFYNEIRNIKGYPSYIRIYNHFLELGKFKDFCKYLKILQPVITEMQTAKNKLFNYKE